MNNYFFDEYQRILSIMSFSMNIIDLYFVKVDFDLLITGKFIISGKVISTRKKRNGTLKFWKRNNSFEHKIKYKTVSFDVDKNVKMKLSNSDDMYLKTKSKTYRIISFRNKNSEKYLRYIPRLDVNT